MRVNHNTSIERDKVCLKYELNLFRQEIPTFDEFGACWWLDRVDTERLMVEAQDMLVIGMDVTRVRY